MPDLKLKPLTFRQRLQIRAATLAAGTTGDWVDRRYIVRNILIAEFGITTSYAQRLAQQAVKKE